MYGHDKYGHDEGHDSGHEVGLKQRHHCTDIPCCLLFVVAVSAFVMLYATVMANGNINRLYHGKDYMGQVCGIDAAVRSEPYLYWCMSSGSQGGLSLNLGKPVCVTSCPASEYSTVEPCQAVSGSEGLASYTTKQILKRYCVPDPIVYPDALQQISNEQLGGFGTNFMDSVSSIPSAWPVFVCNFFVAVVMGYIYLALLRHCAECLIWLCMLLSIVGFALLGLFLWKNAGEVSSKIGLDEDITTGMSEYETNMTRAAAALCEVLAVVMIFLMCCLKHSIDAASACVEVACEAMFEMPSLLLAPVLKAVFKGILIVVLLNGFLLLNSYDDGSDSTGAALLLAYMLVAFWILAFIQALYQFIVAYAMAEYYYTPIGHNGYKDVGCCALWDGLHVGLAYHTGSLAFGSLLIATLQTFQKVIEYAQHKNKEAGNNHVISCILCCCLICVHCCKDVVELINKNAYIDIAITSNSFCQAAQEALQMIAELGGSMAILNGATFVFSLLGTIVITLAAGAAGYAFSDSGAFADDASAFHVTSPIAVMCVSMVIGFLVALSFMNIFDMASDSLLYCYGLDLHSGEGSATAPQALKDLVHNSGHDGHGESH